MSHKTQKVLVSLPIALLKQMDSLVEDGVFSSRSALIEQAVRELIAKELQVIEAVKQKLKGGTYEREELRVGWKVIKEGR